jgi:hypothetical protein
MHKNINATVNPPHSIFNDGFTEFMKTKVLVLFVFDDKSGIILLYMEEG